MNYHFNRFCLIQRLHDDVFLYTNFETEKQVLLKGKIHAQLQEYTPNLLNFISKYPNEAKILIEHEFILKETVNEWERYMRKRMYERQDSSIYHVIVNPTLDCNLNCWYCYESRIKGSLIQENVIMGICKNIDLHFQTQPFKCLKLSFFGGEPFLQWNAMKKLIEFASRFAKNKGIELLLDFTTNATLIKNSYLEFLKDFECQFQITLDGNQEQHNKIKFFRNQSIDTYKRTLDCIYKIQSVIPASVVYVRINFDEKTLFGFSSILNTIHQLNRKKTIVILKKIWQIEASMINRDLIETAIDDLLRAGFIIDYYGQGGWCFADLDNQETINYDGNVYRCTTIDVFDESTSLGKLDDMTGNIYWKSDRIEYLKNNDIAPMCRVCKLLPKCGGPCRKQMSQGLTDKCFLKDQGITIEDYAEIMLQINHIRNKTFF